MCGIAGIVSLNGAAVSEQGTRAMTRALAHRGPDGEGIHVSGTVGLGHRRLAILDPKGGAQPMFTPDGRVAIVFNGEIYNFRELRVALESKGHTFSTNCDTEVILHAWLEWGAACVERFRGMFALGLVDWRQRILFLARDHFGIKPLVYTHQQGLFAFASEIQALRSLPGVGTIISPPALDAYLALGYIPAPTTAFTDILKLPPAHRMLIPLDGGDSVLERYWTPSFSIRHDRSPDDWAEETESVLRESVKAHLVSDVPFGAFLSGGMDSTAVLGWMTQSLNTPVQAFTIGFDDSDYDETPYARIAAAKWGARHVVDVVTPDAISILPDLVRHYGEPFGDSSSIPSYYVSRLARASVPMVLSGDGGDEFFGGYRRYGGWQKWIHPKVPRRAAWKQQLRPLLSSVDPGHFPPDPTYRKPTGEGWAQFVGGIPVSVRQRLWKPGLMPPVDPAAALFDRVLLDDPPQDPSLAGHGIDMLTYLPHDILTKMDIVSMMHGLEVRTPLVDLRVAALAATIPPELRGATLNGDEWTGKPILRSLLARDFAPDFIDRPKQGFVVPMRRWLQPNGLLRATAEERLLHGDHVLNYLRPEGVQELFSMHDRGVDQSSGIWQLMVLDEWLSQQATGSLTS